jgi:hypothetical protein
MKAARPRPMSVTFIRTGERRYAVRATVHGAVPVQMDAAPGFDPAMPHDLQHFIVEKCLQIRGGVFGRLAAGGTAATFHPVAVDGGDVREASRTRRKYAARDRKLMPAERDDYDRSERATYVCWQDWLSHASDAGMRARAASMRATAASMLARMEAREKASLNPQKLGEIRQEFQRLSERWSSLRVGESMSEEW